MPQIIRQLEEIIESVKYGEVKVTVQDGKVVLIEKNEKFKPKA